MPTKLNLTGQQFNRLTAVRKVGRTSKGLILWLFKCECGNFIKRIVADVKRGNTQSCGCLAIDRNRERNLKLIPVGNKFGRWVILSYIGTNKYRESLYKVRCICGVIRKVGRSSLINQKSLSCGCFMVDKLRERLTIHGKSKTKEYKKYHARKRRAVQ